MSDAVNKADLEQIFSPKIRIIDWDDIEVRDVPKDWEKQLWNDGYDCRLFFLISNTVDSRFYIPVGTGQVVLKAGIKFGAFVVFGAKFLTCKIEKYVNSGVDCMRFVI
jgi:hypothetical protein